MVHKVENGQKLIVFDTLQVEKGMFMTISSQYLFEERGTCCQDHFVSLNLVIITGECHIKEVFVFSQLFKC